MHDVVLDLCHICSRCLYVMARTSSFVVDEGWKHFRLSLEQSSITLADTEAWEPGDSAGSTLDLSGLGLGPLSTCVIAYGFA